VSPSRTRSAFTLIELLIVIAVIATLMGLLIPSVMFVQARAKKAKTRSFLAQIEAALSTYKNVNGIYPENIGGDPTTPMTATATANAAALHTALLTVDRENFRGVNLNDPYGNPVCYRPAKKLEFLPKVAAPGHPQYDEHIDGEKPPGADSYQLWSTGSNGTDEVSTSPAVGEYGDDIVTWK